MTMAFAPKLAILALIEAWAPCPMATMAMTAPTPMITPSIVKVERITLRPRARCAILMAMNTRTTVCPPGPLEAQPWWTRGACGARGTALTSVLVHQADDDLLSLLQIVADELGVLLVAHPKTHGNRTQEAFRRQGPHLRRPLPALALSLRERRCAVTGAATPLAEVLFDPLPLLLTELWLKAQG